MRNFLKFAHTVPPTNFSTHSPNSCSNIERFNLLFLVATGEYFLAVNTGDGVHVTLDAVDLVTVIDQHSGFPEDLSAVEARLVVTVP